MLESTLCTFLIAAHSKICATTSSLGLLLMLSGMDAAMPSHPPFPRKTKALNALIRCYNLVQQVSEPQLPARSERAVHVLGAAVKGTRLREVYWFSTSHLLGGSQGAGICELANSAFLPCWHNVRMLPSGKPYDHLFAGPVLEPKSFEAVSPRHQGFTL